MTTPENRAEALDAVRERTDRAAKIRTLAEEAVSASNRDRALAIKAAMRMAPAKEVAEAAGVSVTRLYQLIKDI